MKSTLRHTVPLLLSLCVLLGSVGVALSEQLCLMTGLKKVEALAHADDCCDSEKPAAQDDDCCTEKVSFAKLETVSSQKAQNVAAPIFFFTEIQPVLAGWLSNLTEDQKLLSYSDSSPPLYGRALLHRLQVLII